MDGKPDCSPIAGLSKLQEKPADTAVWIPALYRQSGCCRGRPWGLSCLPQGMAQLLSRADLRYIVHPAKRASAPAERGIGQPSTARFWQNPTPSMPDERYEQQALPAPEQDQALVEGSGSNERARYQPSDTSTAIHGHGPPTTSQASRTVACPAVGSQHTRAPALSAGDRSRYTRSGTFSRRQESPWRLTPAGGRTFQRGG
jgi:hypothetical protein